MCVCRFHCVQCLDYSDDEAERRAKAKLRMRAVVRDGDSGEEEDNDSSSDNDSQSPQKTTMCRQRNRYVMLSDFLPADKDHRG